MSQYNYEGTLEEIQREDTKKDAVLNALKTKTPEEIRTWVDNNVNNVADIKTMLARLMILVSVLARDLE